MLYLWDTLLDLKLNYFDPKKCKKTKNLTPLDNYRNFFASLKIVLRGKHPVFLPSGRQCHGLDVCVYIVLIFINQILPQYCTIVYAQFCFLTY